MTKVITGDDAFVEHALSETGAIRLYRPSNAHALAPAVLFIHGGGLVIGTPQQDEARLRRLADDLGAVVATVRYGLAPQHRFPIAVEDCYLALTHLAAAPGIDTTRIAIAGNSAGGGLAAAVAVAARDRGGPPLCFQLLIYPMLDDRTAARPDPDPSYRRLWNNAANHVGWSSYLGEAPGGKRVSALAAPSRCLDLIGLPPAWIGVGTLDLFYQENLDYAARLRAAGVPVSMSVVPGVFHGFDGFGKSDVVRAFIRAQDEALSAALNEHPR